MRDYNISAHQLIEKLKGEKIKTWFDLGIFIDRFKESKALPTAEYKSNFEQCIKDLSCSSMGFITFMYSIDGVTIEIEKYTQVFKKVLPGIDVHYIGGKFYPEANEIVKSDVKKCEMPEIDGFNNWPLYQDFFYTRLERGSKSYNDLIIKFWNDVLTIVEKLAKYIVENEIKLLYLVNVCSNPGNVSLALATVLISEYLGIPVMNNNHDFYWEGGSQQLDINLKKSKKGPRDFFFTNAHLGEVFSLIQVLYPWESRSWINVNINKDQSRHLIIQNGHNPANVTEIGTAVDTSVYFNVSKRRKINAFFQFEKILSRYQDVLIGYSAEDVIKNHLVDEHNTRPILVGNKTRKISKFLNENIILLQPTRIIGRKRIELGFKLIKQLFKNPEFAERLKNTSNLKITLIITGPIANGHFLYYQDLISSFSKLISSISEDLQDKIYLAFLFSELDQKSFKSKFVDPVDIPDLYNIASLVLLPSKTEGRGLPIIEATACGTPIFCRRYTPEKVYSEVIGEHLPEKQRLKVIEFQGKKISSKHAEKIIERIFFPHLYTPEVLHNKEAVQQRFSINSLTENIVTICKTLHNQLQPNNSLISRTEALFEWYKKMVSFTNEDLQSLINTKTREYLAGYGKLAFMLQLKSLIDPSAFRMEEQNNRGFIHSFAKYLVNHYCQQNKIELSDLCKFYNAVDNIFYIRKGEHKIRHDHAFSYRHRNKYYYLYQDYTLQELTGLVNILFQEIINPRIEKNIDEVSYFFTDLELALAQLTSSFYLAIDHRKRLIKSMQQNVSFGIFPGEHTKYELEFFVLQSIRSRLKLSIETSLSKEILQANKDKLAPVYVFANELSIGAWFNKAEILEYINSGKEPELKLLYDFKILNIINSRQVCVGLHFPQMGEKALTALKNIQEDKGFIITNRTHASMMSDIVNIDRFHLGKAWSPLQANIMGIPINSGYIQYVPAGIRSTLAYPTPIQTAYTLSKSIESKKYNQLVEIHGEDKLLKIIKKEVEQKGTPVDFILNNLLLTKKEKNKVEFEFVNGIYSDKLPWNGVFAKALTSDKNNNWKFRALNSEGKTKTVTKFITDFKKTNNKTALIAWNGGYILNPELVGKLGLPESYIGSPLGLLITDGQVVCPPLFNKAALLIDNKGGMSVRKVCSNTGMLVKFGNTEFELTAKNYNQSDLNKEIIYYDLLYPREEIAAKDRYIIRISGNTIKEIIEPGNSSVQKIIPVGLTFSFSKESFSYDIKEGDKIKITMKGLEDIEHAIGAGPHLIDNGEIILDMEKEGWTTNNSIRTQAARLDYTDMRGPKIAIGIDKKNDFYVLVINGRIRESVGATHFDMAKILLDAGMVSAMGFDPGGSSTLVVNGKTLNISPYNKEYEKNIYALPPEPRAVSNAVIGYIE